MLSDALAASLPVVGLGRRRGASLGFSAVGYVEDWKPVISRSIQRAELVFVLPSDNAGTQWEIGEIVSLGALKKTVFVMPSAAYLKTTEKKFRDKWNAGVQKLCNECGLQLPEYSAQGMLFSMTDDGVQASRKASFSPESPRTLAVCLQHFLASHLGASRDNSAP